MSLSQHLQDFIDQTVNTLISDSLQDAKSRCVESCESDDLVSQLRLKISRARQEVDIAEQSFLRKKENLRKLKSKLESETMKLVSNLPSVGSDSSGHIDRSGGEEVTGRRWRVAGLKVRLGLGIKRRDLRDTSTFIVRDTQVRDTYKSVLFLFHLPGGIKS